MLIEAKCVDISHNNIPSDIFVCFVAYFQLDLNATCFLCGYVVLKIVGYVKNIHNDKNVRNTFSSITVIWLGSEGWGEGDEWYIYILV